MSQEVRKQIVAETTKRETCKISIEMISYLPQIFPATWYLKPINQYLNDHQ